ncbi:phosphoribosyltransferase [Synechococcus sp. PCC 6312]|uniref:phosphoribosyltransferase n=1 Tax=Synechococcus sp. (strain ATCC 27167 / PCC 6312) TaxID=195253 RepID=UPI00029F0F72|nr:phosphoribosyltransferase family protein [Synechococcus sp. PCC 6312]AFY60389.1 putative phosphoribosyltransferase [Synechococcus sp. PCC 6312]
MFRSLGCFYPLGIDLSSTPVGHLGGILAHLLTMIFQDRQDAGLQLAACLRHLPLVNPVVLGIPRGGIMVGLEVACQFQVPLGVVLTRRLTSQKFPEVSFGAIGEEGVKVLDQATIGLMAISDPEIIRAEREAQTELQRRIRDFRHGESLPSLAGKTVIVVDDGLATGLTAWAAIKVVRQHHPTQVIVAVPVASPTSVRKIQQWADAVVTVATPPNFRSVGEWYGDFNPNLSETEVLAALTQANAPLNP